jgi:LacI family transcriptional regulator
MLLAYPFPGSILEKLTPIMPMVSLVEQFDHSGIDCVDVDHYKGISAAVENLVDRGHRKIGFFSRRHQEEAGWSLRRYSAFMEKMARLGLPVSSKDIINVFAARECVDEECFDYAAERTRAGVTAWICAADHQAYRLVCGLQARGIIVPEMVSVTGFDGIAPPLDHPQLATIQIPFREIGATGAQRLIERIRKRYGSIQHVLIDGPFHPGETVGLVPG